MVRKRSKLFLEERIFLFFICVSLIFPWSSVLAAPKTYDMLSSSSYNLFFYGDASYFPTGSIKTADLDNDGKQDIIVASSYADHNSRSNSGSIYVIYGSLLETFSGIGKNLDLAGSSSYNLRFDGAKVTGQSFGDMLGDWSLDVADMNGDGKLDLLIGAINASNNSKASSGSLYIIYNNLFSQYSGTGNIIDLANSANYSLRYDGAVAGDWFSFPGVFAIDLDNDGKKDIVAGASYASYNSRTNSGSLYVIYNTLIDDYSGTGNNINLANSANYNLRYDGTKESDSLSKGGIGFGDLDSDGKQDILVGAYQTDFNSRTDSGSVYLIYNTLIDNYSGTGNNIDLTTSTNYNLRWDGAAASDYLNYWTPIYPADFNNDGKLDLMFGACKADNNSRTDSGSMYVVYNTLIDDYSGTGNNIDLFSSVNYNLRYDGAAIGDELSWKVVVPADFDGNGKQDILVGAYLANNNSRTDSGSLYAIYDSLFDGYTGTGNNIDLADSANYNLRYDGVGTDKRFFGYGVGLPHGGITLSDLNNDGSLDLLIGDNYVQIDTVNEHLGALYIIYNFPHTLSLNSFTATSNDTHFKVGGNITVSSNSITSFSGLQYQVDSGSWTTCTADDQSFNSSNEGYTCDQTASLKEGAHTANIRAYDTNSSYSAGANYHHLDLVIDLTAPAISELAISNVSLVSSGGKYPLDPSQPNQRTPSFSGKALDTYQGYSQTNNDGTKESYLKVSSGPDKIILSLKKLKEKENPNSANPTYLDHLTKEYSLTDIKDDLLKTEKYARFLITVPYPLIDGYYQVNLSLKDKAGNTYNHPTFYLSLNYSISAPTAITKAKEQSEIKIIEQKPSPTEQPSFILSPTEKPEFQQPKSKFNLLQSIKILLEKLGTLFSGLFK